ncbi:MAG: hypothetical protein U5J63_14700 [Fodinibius sp.]|nr:hypothetical protein [Fodinibius sp.]
MSASTGFAVNLPDLGNGYHQVEVFGKILLGRGIDQRVPGPVSVVIVS